MHRVDIYLESDSGYMGRQKRKTGYYMTCRLGGREYNDLKITETEGTYNHCMLETLDAALSRMQKASELHIHSANLYILDMLEKNLANWAENGFANRKGEPVKDKEYWKSVWERMDGHIMVAEKGPHEYSHWMKWMFTHDPVDNYVDKSQNPHKQL